MRRQHILLLLVALIAGCATLTAHARSGGPLRRLAQSTSDLPDAPNPPDVPSTPETPDQPEVPDQPDTPSPPDVPDQPDTPAIPDTPSIPDEPETPAIPAIPDAPSTPDVPSVDDIPNPLDDNGAGSNNDTTTVEPAQGGLVLDEECGNRDMCAAGLTCLGNKCLSAPEGQTLLGGTGNKCSESDCCGTGLSCNLATKLCVPSTTQLPILACRVEEVAPPTPNPDAPVVVPPTTDSQGNPILPADGNAAVSLAPSMVLVLLALISVVAVMTGAGTRW